MMLSKNNSYLSRIKIKIISLDKDSDRRASLEIWLKPIVGEYEIKNAVNGMDVDDSVVASVNEKRKKAGLRNMTKAEYGCAKSHLEVLGEFLKDESSDGLIVLEDDIKNHQVETLHHTLKCAFNEPTCVILGGQEGLQSANFIYGKSSKDSHLTAILQVSYVFVQRTCCYYVNKEAARIIINNNKEIINIADDWQRQLNSRKIKLYFKKIFSHPEGVVESNIERSRLAIHKDYISTKKRSLLIKSRKILLYFIVFLNKIKVISKIEKVKC